MLDRAESETKGFQVLIFRLASDTWVGKMFIPGTDKDEALAAANRAAQEVLGLDSGGYSIVVTPATRYKTVHV